MVIFLHLANERELVIHELAGGLDILLALQ